MTTVSIVFAYTAIALICTLFIIGTIQDIKAFKAREAAIAYGWAHLHEAHGLDATAQRVNK